MHDFQLSLRLDTPLLMGGAVSKAERGQPKPADSLAAIRASEVRGLLHHFARAVIGPLAGSANRTREAELMLFGEAGGKEREPPTVRISDNSDGELDTGSFPNRPGDEAKGRHTGWVNQQTRTVAFRFRPHALKKDKELPRALWAICWIAFAFGSLGNRCRRGYGSLTIQTAAGIPELDNTLPLFAEAPANEADLRKQLETGLDLAREVVSSWLQEKGLLPTSTPSPSTGWFQLGSFAQVDVFSAKSGETWEAAMKRLMDVCSDMLRKDSERFRNTVGSAARPRLASPLWVRLYRLKAGYAYVATLSPFDGSDTPKFATTKDQLPKAILSAVKAKVAES